MQSTLPTRLVPCPRCLQLPVRLSIDGMVMHGQMADYYDFLGLEGFARLHGYHFSCETISMRRIHRYFIGHYNRLLPEANITHPDVIPVAWSNFTRQAVESETKSKAVETGMHAWCGWGRDTKDLYAESAKDLYDAGDVAAAVHGLRARAGCRRRMRVCRPLGAQIECRRLRHVSHRAYAARAAREI